MPTTISHSPQEISALCGQLSVKEQQEVFDYITHIVDFKKQQNKPKNLSKYFGSLQLKQDALLIQKAMRDEWN